MGIFSVKPPEPPIRHEGEVLRIAHSTYVGGGLGMGTYTSMTCHLMLEHVGVRSIVSFSYDDDPAIALTEKGDRVVVLLRQDGEDVDLVGFRNETNDLEADVNGEKSEFE
jgi:hypothetical protein